MSTSTRTLAGRLLSHVRQLRQSEKAQGLVEYALIVGIVSLGAIASLTFLKDNITGLFSGTGSNLSASTSPPPAPVITAGPTQPETTARDAMFAYTTQYTDFVECKLDAAAWSVCPDTGVQYVGPLSVAAHQFQVRARNDWGTSPEANWDWTILASPPPGGTSVVIGSGGPLNTYYYYPAGAVTGSGLNPPGGLEGWYAVFTVPPGPDSIPPIDGWTFGPCTWHNAFWWSGPAMNGNPAHPFLISACVKEPANSVAPSITGTPQVGQTLTGSPGSWTNATSYDYRWRRCNASGAACVDISGSGAAGTTYVVQGSDAGSTLRFEVTGNNALGDSTTVESAQTAVVVGPPTGGSVSIGGGSPQTGPVTLTATTLLTSWAGGPQTITFQWERATPSGSGSCSSGGTGSYNTFGGSTHTGVPAVASTTDQLVGATATFCYRVRVQGVNSYGSSPLVTSSNTVRVDPPPAPSVPTINSGPNNAGNDAAHTAPTFTFTQGANTTSLECRFDTGGSQGTWGACTSPQSYGPGLGVNSYQFNVRGIGPGGTGNAATRSFSVALPGAPNITGGPSGSGSTSTYTNPSFTFSAGSNSTGSECRLDTGGSQGTWTACTSPKSYGPGLALGSYQFNVRGTSPVGPGPADTQSWTVTTPQFSGGETTDLGGLANPTTTYGYINQSGSLSSEANRRIAAPSNLTIRGFHVTMTSTNAVYNFVVRVNGSNVATLTCSGGTSPCNITGQSISVLSGQFLVIQVNKTGSSNGNRTATWTVDYTVP